LKQLLPLLGVLSGNDITRHFDFKMVPSIRSSPTRISEVGKLLSAFLKKTPLEIKEINSFTENFLRDHLQNEYSLNDIFFANMKHVQRKK